MLEKAPPPFDNLWRGAFLFRPETVAAGIAPVKLGPTDVTSGTK